MHRYWQWRDDDWHEITLEKFTTLKEGAWRIFKTTAIATECMLAKVRRQASGGNRVILMQTKPDDLPPWSMRKHENIVGGSTAYSDHFRLVNFPGIYRLRVLARTLGMNPMDHRKQLSLIF